MVDSRDDSIAARGPHTVKTDLLLIPMSARWADMRAAALAAEESGFDGLWTWDHLRDPDEDGGPGVPEAWTVLTALAEVTRRVALGPLVLNVANRQPGLPSSSGARAKRTRRRGATPRRSSSPSSPGSTRRGSARTRGHVSCSIASTSTG
jgi:hypothetical protein